VLLQFVPGEDDELARGLRLAQGTVSTSRRPREPVPPVTKHGLAVQCADVCSKAGSTGSLRGTAGSLRESGRCA
jgi:hypothetical protein